MSDDIQRNPPDVSLVMLREEWQVRYWSRQFGVRPKDLKRAVRTVGDDPEDVKRYIDEHIERALKESAAEGD